MKGIVVDESSPVQFGSGLELGGHCRWRGAAAASECEFETLVLAEFST